MSTARLKTKGSSSGIFSQLSNHLTLDISEFEEVKAASYSIAVVGEEKTIRNLTSEKIIEDGNGTKIFITNAEPNLQAEENNHCIDFSIYQNKDFFLVCANTVKELKDRLSSMVRAKNTCSKTARIIVATNDEATYKAAEKATTRRKGGSQKVIEAGDIFNLPTEDEINQFFINIAQGLPAALNHKDLANALTALDQNRFAPKVEASAPIPTPVASAAKVGSFKKPITLPSLEMSQLDRTPQQTR